MDDLDITARVRALRISQGLTQQQFADALGRQLVWVKKFEAGVRQADPRISLLRDICRALGVPLASLLDEPETSTGQGTDDIRATLLRPVPTGVDTGLDVVRQTIYGYAAFQAGRFHDLRALLPDLLNAARAAEAALRDPRTGRQLANVCHLTAIALIKFDDGAAAWNAADKALAVADALDDPVEIALAAQTVAYAETVIGQAAAGMAAAHDAIDRTASALSDLGEDGWTALGLLYLKAAVCAAGIGDAAGAREMIDAGRSAGERVRADANVRCTGFNATNVLLYEASVLGDLGEHAAALDAATRIHPGAFAALPRERRIHHLIDTARSAAAVGRPDGALNLLLQAERDNAQAVRTLPQARAVIAGLLADRRGPSDRQRLRALAGRAGVNG